MNNDPLYRRMRETAWRRKLTPDETAELEQWLASHPGAEHDWEDELALTGNLDRLGDVPVASNFTARVVRRAERHSQETAPGLRPDWAGFWRRFAPRFGVAAVAALMAFIGYGRYEIAQRARIARSVATVSEVATIPSAEALRDFDTVRALAEARNDSRVMPDNDLLALNLR